MKIIFHIFKKDFRRHCPEFLVSLIFLAIFLWDQPRQWTVHPPEFRFFSSLLRYLPHFLSLSWAFLLIRLVQGESLVGDRQFWLTRPYKWHTLLSAKLLAALLLVHLPLFLAQLLLLKLAFYPVLASVPGLLQIQFMFFSIITLGSFVVGSITRGVGEAALVVLGLFLLLLAIASLSFVFPSLNFSLDDFDDVIACVAFAAATTIVVVNSPVAERRSAGAFSRLVSPQFFCSLLFLVIRPVKLATCLSPPRRILCPSSSPLIRAFRFNTSPANNWTPTARTPRSSCLFFWTESRKIRSFKLPASNWIWIFPPATVGLLTGIPIPRFSFPAARASGPPSPSSAPSSIGFATPP